MQETPFDYVIVGGGSGGATLAARLSEDPATSVCLVEAGGDGRSILVRAPAAVVAMLPGKPLKINNYALQTEPQPGLGGRRGYQPRGKCLGGSSAINAMLYVRGHPSDYDSWAAQGCTGWSFDEVLPYFLRSEDNERGESPLHGGSGPLKVANQRNPRPITEAFVRAAGECGIPRNDDFNGPEQEGAGIYQVTQFHEGSRRGERCSAAAAYLHPVQAQRPNLTLWTDTRAERIVFEGTRAIGVQVRRGDGPPELLKARREVALCGGSFHSPQLLLLSGVGAPAELQRHGIAIQHALPGVGQNLQDHLDFILSCTSRDTDLFGIGVGAGLRLLRAAMQWRRDGGGIIATPFAEGGAFLRSRPDVAQPDLQLHFCISIVDDHARKLHWGYGYSCHVCVLRPRSRGEVTLHSAQARDAPRIDPRFLSEPQDLALLLAGARRMRDIMRAPALAPFCHRKLFASDTDTDEALVEQIRQRSDTIYHPVGTCRMGAADDAAAVVDPHLRVRGLQGLRVVDASVMPTLIGGNTNAPTIMMAERAAEWMKADAWQAA